MATIVIEDRRNLKFGGRHVVPDENGIFKSDKQVGSVEICSAGSGTHSIMPEDCEQRIEENTTDPEAIKKDIERIEIEIDELKQRILKSLINIIYGLFMFQERKERNHEYLVN